MGLPPTDFESVASAIPPLGRGAEIYAPERRKAGTLIPAAPPSGSGTRLRLYHGPSALTPHVPTLTPLHPHLIYPLDKPLAQLLILGALHGSQVRRHLPIFVL